MPDLLQHFVDGQWVTSTASDAIDVTDPATGAVVARIPAGTPADAAAAASAAAKAAHDWARVPPAERAAAVRAAATALRTHLDELTEIQTRENGRPLGDSRGGVLAGIGALEQYAELGPLHRGRALQGGWHALDLMVPEPRGVAALLVPWNDPVAIACQLLGAALVTGNTVVLKPSERTPLNAVRLVEVMAPEFPRGVLNLLLGDARAGRPLVAHADVDVVVHVGSMATGREIAEQCAPRLRKAVLELGGNDPLVVDADVDPVWAAEQAAAGAFANAGQICTSVERIYAHADIAEPFVTALVACAEALRMGPGTDPDTTLGPLIDDRQREVVHRHVTEAVARGAQLRTGGEVPDRPGCYYPATVLTDVTDDMLVMREETFGPVAPVRTVQSFDEALRAAAESDYGLAATVLTGSQEHAQRAWRELPVGTVKVNAVWGGAPGGAAEPHRGSGRGFGYGPELLDELTTTKVVHYRALQRR